MDNLELFGLLKLVVEKQYISDYVTSVCIKNGRINFEDRQGVFLSVYVEDGTVKMGSRGITQDVRECLEFLIGSICHVAHVRELLNSAAYLGCKHIDGYYFKSRGRIYELSRNYNTQIKVRTIIDDGDCDIVSISKKIKTSQILEYEPFAAEILRMNGKSARK